MTKTGERIFELRTKNGMSQGSLADKLDVSRQTVSKWENGICMPETEKLVILSDVFGVSTDYILKGEQSSSEPTYIYVKNNETSNHTHNELIVRKYLGIVLAVVFSLVAIILILAGGSIIAIIPGAVALLGVLFAANAKHPWLVTAWATYIISLVALSFFTAINPLMIFNPVIYTKGYTLHLLWCFGIYTYFATLILATIKAKRGYIFKKSNKLE